MYLSRLVLDARLRSVQRDLANCHELHRTLLSAFPKAQSREAGARAAFGLLYRVERETRGDAGVVVIAQSHELPDWSRLPKPYLMRAGEGTNLETKDISAHYQSLTCGAILRFRLRANPTRRLFVRGTPEGRPRDGKRVELRTEAEWLAWLQRKGAAGGFALLPVASDPTVLDVRAVDTGKLKGRRPAEGATREAAWNVTLAGVQFDGRLRVTDGNLFYQTMKEGIGSGKAYGFGLLSVARLE